MHLLTKIDSLEPLRGLRLKEFSITGYKGSSIEPLRGMPLESIRITGFRGLLHPLKGAPLKKFYIDYGESINGLKEVRDFINNKLAYTTLHEYDYLDDVL